jgi:heat-inducible transcriptional repressor
MITDLGHVESKKILIPEGLSVKEIEKVIGVLDEILHNCLVCEIESKLKEEITNEDVRDFILYREDLVNAFASAFADMAKDKYHVQGQSKMLLQPEFQDVEKLKEIYEAIEQREILKVVKYDETGITVRIGQENEIKALQDCTVITVPYESSSGERGAISVFGPTRMEYNKIIPLLEYIAKNIKNIV